MKCKNCNKEFHYCTSCDYEEYSFMGYCSEKCMKEYCDYVGFWSFFKDLMRNRSSFENLVIRDCKDELWSAWCYQEEERKESERNN